MTKNYSIYDLPIYTPKINADAEYEILFDEAQQTWYTKSNTTSEYYYNKSADKLANYVSGGICLPARLEHEKEMELDEKIRKQVRAELEFQMYANLEYEIEKKLKYLLRNSWEVREELISVINATTRSMTPDARRQIENVVMQWFGAGDAASVVMTALRSWKGRNEGNEQNQQFFNETFEFMHSVKPTEVTRSVKLV